MKWISIKDKLPEEGQIIVAITKGRFQCGDDPVEDAEIVLLKTWGDKIHFTKMDCADGSYGLAGDEYMHFPAYIIEYWIPWQEFPFPESMIRKKKDKE